MSQDKRKFESNSYYFLDGLLKPDSGQSSGEPSKNQGTGTTGRSQRAQHRPLDRDLIMRLIQTLKER